MATTPFRTPIIGAPPAPARFFSVSCPSSSIQFRPSSSSPLSHSSSVRWRRTKSSASAAVFNQESLLTEEIENSGGGGALESELRKEVKPCELYVCNLPRSCDVPQLVELFQPYGTVVSVEVSKNLETGVSKGCGNVTMGSKASATRAMKSLDGIDVQGREMRVRLTSEMNQGSGETSLPMKALIYESPHKLYVGNLAWSVKPEDLRNEFSRFGNVASVRVLYDRKGGRLRAYAFVSFSNESERQASLSLDGRIFHDRELVVRSTVDRQDLPNPTVVLQHSPAKFSAM